MSASFDTDFAAVDDQFAEMFGDAVTIKRGSRTSLAVIAQLFEGTGSVENDDGVTTTVDYLEAIIARSDYLFTGLGAVEPLTGDRLVTDDNREWQCMPVLNYKEVTLLPGGTEWLVRYKQVL